MAPYNFIIQSSLKMCSTKSPVAAVMFQFQKENLFHESSFNSLMY